MLKKIIALVCICFTLGYISSSQNFFPKSKRVFSYVTTFQNQETAIVAEDIVEATNTERIKEGLMPLLQNPILSESASIKIDDMIAKQYFEHVSPSGKGVSDLAKEKGYEYVVLGENLAMGTFDSSDEIVKAWMDSPGHRANILNKNYQDIGISVKKGIYEGKEIWFSVQHFGTSRKVCPSIEEDVKKRIDIINAELKSDELIISNVKQVLEAPNAQYKPSYQSDVQLFNRQIEAYNIKLKNSRVQIELYNDSVKKFNTCIGSFQ